MATHIPQIRIISYSPMTIESEGRLADFFATTSDGAWALSCCKKREPRTTTEKVNPRPPNADLSWACSGGWTARSLGANKSCGVMILFNSKRFPADSCSNVYTPEEALWRRAGAIRLSARNSNFLVICLCVPSFQSGSPRVGQIPQYCAGAWQQVVSDALHRTLPTIGLDLDDSLGRWKGRPIVSEAISAGCIREETSSFGK